MAALTDRVIRGEGCGEAVWLPWLQTLPTQPVTLDDLVPIGKRLVVVAPHPDDEILVCGALIALQAQAGGKLLVVYVTDGEASHGRIGATARRALAENRRQESELGLATLGATNAAAVRLNMGDGLVAASGTPLWSKLLQILQASDVVVTTWALDGHPDHEATSRVTAMACKLVGCEVIEAPVWMWHWSQPRDPRVPFSTLVGLPVSPLVAHAKQAALLCHKSQLSVNLDRSTPVLGQAIRQRVARPVEYFFASGALRERLQPRLL